MIYDENCFICGEKLTEFGGVYMLGLDRPYVNLWFHRDCFNNIEEDLLMYLNTKIDKIRKEIPNYD
jgi:hypothetical protein